MSLKLLLKRTWLYSWTLIVPLTMLASLMDLFLLGGVRLFFSMISDSNKYFFGLKFLQNINILHWLGLMLIIITVRYMVITLRVRTEERLNYRLASHLRVWWLRTVKKIHPLQLHKAETDSILHNSNLSVSAMPRGCKVITQSIQAVSQLIFFLPVLFFLSWQLSLILLFVFTPVVFYFQQLLKKASADVNDYNKFSGDYDFHLWRWTALNKSWSSETELSKYSSLLFDKIRNLRDTSMKMGVRDATIMQGIETLSVSIMILVLGTCAMFIKTQAMAPFEIALFCAALIICYKPLKECSQLLSNIRDLKITYSGLHSLENMPSITKFFTEHEDESIKIDNMSFRYGSNEPWVFQSYSNVLRLNRPIILQGENGAGKTTMLRILSGLEIPEQGKVFMPMLSEHCSFYFSQRLFLPPIAWLESEIASKNWSNNIKDFFNTLGLDTLMKKKGHSNGELQRIGLAWAVVSEKPFLFLDEPLAYISQDLKEPIFKAFWNATTETGQWWIMASHTLPPSEYRERIGFWKI